MSSRKEGWLQRTVLLAGMVVALLSVGAEGFATSAYQSGSDWILENANLKVTVKPSTGYISVYDKAIGKTWTQPGAVTHYAFTSVSTYGIPQGLGFWTTFKDSSAGSLSGFVQLILPDGQKNLQMTVNLSNVNQVIGGFDFFEPWTLTSSTSYLVAPDYCDGHMYPTDISYWPIYSLDWYRVSGLDMPWIGIFDMSTGQGYCAIVDTTWDAIFKCVKFSGRRAPRVSWEPQLGKFGYLRSVTYSFTSAGGYVGLAKAYRSYVESKGELVTLATKAAQYPNVSRLYGAPGVWDWSHVIPDKTLKTIGVDRFLHHLEVAGDSDNTREINDLGFVTEEYDSYVDACPIDPTHPLGSYYDTYPDNYAKSADGSTRKGWLASRGQMYRRCPDFYLPAAEAVISSRLATNPLLCRYMDVHTANFGYEGSCLEECWDPAHPKTRREWQQDHYDLLSYVRGLGQVLSCEHGKWWAIPKVDVFYGMMSSPGWPWTDYQHPTYYGQTDYGSAGTMPADAWSKYETWGSLGYANRVPLWDLVYHDCSISMWYPWDATDWSYSVPNDTYQVKKDTYNVLYANPAFFFTEPNVGSWFSNRRAFMDSYRVCKVHEALAEKEMVSHEFLNSDRSIQKTTWSDGTQIIVNFGTGDYFADVGYQYNQLLKQNCWTVKGPAIQATKSYLYDAGRILTYIKIDGYHFDDEQVSNGKPVPLALRRTNPNCMRVNADYNGSQMSFVIYPKKVQPNWNINRTKVYLCNKDNGDRIRMYSWTPSGDTGLQVGPFNDWTVLDMVSTHPENDFDGDNKSDVAFFGNSMPLVWDVYTSGSSYTGSLTSSFGDAAGDIPIAADYDADGKCDWIVFRPGNPAKFIIKTQAGTETTLDMGSAGDVPVTGDFDGDGLTDFGACTSTYPMSWKILLSSTNYSTSITKSLGSATNHDVPIPDDYDGDGKADFAVYHPASASRWYVINSSTNTSVAYSLGKLGDTPVNGDYDGDGRADMAVCTSTSPMTWKVLLSSTNFTSTTTTTWGDAAFHDIPLQGDFDGDGKSDYAVYRPSDPGQVLISYSSGGTAVFTCGSGVKRLIGTVSDVTNPVINSVSVNPTLVGAGDRLHISVSVSDNEGLANVTANGSPLVNTSGTTWAGDIWAVEERGLQNVSVEAYDFSCNHVGASEGYKVVPIVGTSIRNLTDNVMADAAKNYLFAVWGKAVKLDDNSFTLDDGSGFTVTVTSASHGVNTGDYVRARGVLNPDPALITLTSDAAYISIINL